MATAEQVTAAAVEVETTTQNKIKHDPSGFFHFRPEMEAVGERLYSAQTAFTAAHAPGDESPAIDAALTAAGPALAAAQALQAGFPSVNDWEQKVRALTEALQAAT